MDSRQAKEILRLYRPWNGDLAEPEVREALEKAAHDPELKHWLDEHCRTQSEIRNSLKRIPVPVGLKQRILEQHSAPGKVVWWGQFRFYVPAAAAACILALAALLFWTQRVGNDNFAAYRKRMVQQVQRMYSMDMVTNDLTGIRHYLAENHGHPDYDVPKPVEDLSGIGCAILKWRSKNVSLVCLRAAAKSDLYLFVISRRDVVDPPPATTRPEFRSVGKLMSASWSKGDKAYVLAGDEPALRQMFP